MKDKTTIKYIVSACLAGEKCRYDGNANTVDTIKNLVENGSAITVCPEVEGGLPVPRVKCEIHNKEDGSSYIMGEDGNNYTEFFVRGASAALKKAEENGITHAILKANSPSCGCGFIYDGTFSGKIIGGNGVTAELFIKSGISVFTEKELEKLKLTS